MVDTNRARSALATLLADNTSGDISPQDLRDFLRSVQLLNVPNEQTGSTYTFALADADNTVIFNRASAQAVTIPPNSSVAFPVGTRIPCLRKGTGLPTISPDTGVTLNKPASIKPNRPMGCMAKLSADISAANYTTATAIPWDGTDVFDTDGFHDPASSNTKIIIPSGLGIAKANITFNIRATSVNTAVWYNAAIAKAGSTSFDGAADILSGTGAAGEAMASIHVQNAAAVGADEWTSLFQVQTDTSITIVAARSNFGVEVTEINPVGSIAYQHGIVFLEKIDTDVWTIGGPALG